ncbi:MAG: hypothetical protein PF690_08390 [Deltaproteobacteria bacterium]|nr:hypothetical protein [Deltaproteobacteria bacterium]
MLRFFAVAAPLYRKTLHKKLPVTSTFLSWFVGFVLMWVVIWNMNVLPQRLLYIAGPLSLFEAFLATWIIKKLSPEESNEAL